MGHEAVPFAGLGSERAEVVCPEQAFQFPGYPLRGDVEKPLWILIFVLRCGSAHASFQVWLSHALRRVGFQQNQAGLCRSANRAGFPAAVRTPGRAFGKRRSVLGESAFFLQAGAGGQHYIGVLASGAEENILYHEEVEFPERLAPAVALSAALTEGRS